MKANAVVIESPKTASRIFGHTRWDALPRNGCNLPLRLFLRDVLSLPAGFRSGSCSFLASSTRSAFHGISTAFRTTSSTILTSDRHCLTGCSAFLSQLSLDSAKFFTSAFTCSTTRETLTGLVRMARRSIGSRSTNMDMIVILGVLNWRYICFLVPFWYLGHCLSYLNGYYRHFGGNPDEPLAWGVSSYDKLYNWVWFFNGYHAEHHFRPKVHWTRTQTLRERIVEQQRVAGVRVIKPPHALAFLDPDLPSLKQNSRQKSNGRWNLKSARLQEGAN